MKYILVLIVAFSFACSSSQKKVPAGDAQQAPVAAPADSAPEVPAVDPAAPVKEEASEEAKKVEEKAPVADEEVPAAIKSEK